MLPKVHPSENGDMGIRNKKTEFFTFCESSNRQVNSTHNSQNKMAFDNYNHGDIIRLNYEAGKCL